MKSNESPHTNPLETEKSRSPRWRQFVAVGMAGVALFAVVDKATDSEHIGSTEVVIGNGGSAIGAVESGVIELADIHDFDGRAVGNITRAGQEVSRKITDPTTGTIRPYTPIEVSVSRTGLFNRMQAGAELVTVEQPAQE